MTIEGPNPAEGQTPSEPAITAPRRLTTADILAAPDLEEREVFVAQWAGTVRVKGFTKARQQAMRREAALPSGEIDTDRLEMFLFIEGCVDPQFTAENYEQLRNKNASAVDVVLRAITEVSGQAPSSQDEALRTFPN